MSNILGQRKWQARRARELGFYGGLSVAAWLAGCGSGGGSSGGTPPVSTPSVYVSGTAAGGAPLASATVTLKDAAGATTTATTAADGSFQVDVTKLTAPFLLSVGSTSTTPALYSVAFAGGAVANLTPYTSVALQAYYAALGSGVAATFGGTLGAASFPSASQLGLLESPLLGLLQPYLSQAAVTAPASFDFFSTPFSANHTGFDQVLDRTSLAGSLQSLTVDNGNGSTAGSLASSVQIVVTAASGSALAEAVVQSTTTDSSTGASSSAEQSVPVGASAGQQSDLAHAQAGVVALFNQLFALAASKGSSLAASDVQPFVDPAFLDQGQNASAEAATIAGFLSALPAGTSVTANIYRVNHFTDTGSGSSSQSLDATVALVITPSGGTASTQYFDENDNVGVGMVFRPNSSGSWVFYGQQTAYTAHVDLVQSRFYDANQGSEQDGLTMQAQVTAPLGSLLGASVAGPADSLPDCTQNPSPLTRSSVALVQDAGSFENGADMRFDLACAATDAGTLAGAPPAAGTVYRFSLVGATGATSTQSSLLNASTTDNGNLTSLNGVARAAFAISMPSASLAGTTLTLSWTPPTTYPVLYSFVTAFCMNQAELAANAGGTDLQGPSDIAPGTSTGTVAIPASCDGGPIGSLTPSINFVGVHGERSAVQLRLTDSPGS